MNNEKELLSILQELINDTAEKIEKSSLSSISLRIGKCGELENIEIEIKKPELSLPAGNIPAAGAYSLTASSETAAVIEQTKTEIKAEPVAVKSSGFEVKAPLIGIVYSAPSPDAEPYIKVGQKVKKGDILCIIEAMKVMNDVECEKDGTITEIMLKNGEMVQFGDVLAVIE